MTKHAPESIAMVVHEAMRAYRLAIGQEKLPSWTKAPAWMRASTIEGVKFRLKNPKAGPELQHDQWAEEKRASGWRYGRQRNDEKKIHPMLVPYAKLPVAERRKDTLFASIVRAMTE